MSIPSDELPYDARRLRTDVEQVQPSRNDALHAEDDAAVVAALSDCSWALEKNLAGLPDDMPRHAALDAVRFYLGRFAAVTAEHGLPPERAIVLLKRSVRELPAIRPWFGTARDELSHELVQLLITAYYSLDGRQKRR